MLKTMKGLANAILGDMAKAKQLVRERDDKLKGIDQRQDERLIKKEEFEIRSEYRDKLFYEAATARARGKAARQALQRLEPAVLEEMADFFDPADENHWTTRIERSPQAPLRQLAVRFHQDENRAGARVLRRETERRTDIDSETRSFIYGELDSIPTPADALETAEVALEIMKTEKAVELEVRAAVGKVSPVEKLSIARQLQTEERRIEGWKNPKPRPLPDPFLEPLDQETKNPEHDHDEKALIDEDLDVEEIVE